jgi:SH3 domain protein
MATFSRVKTIIKYISAGLLAFAAFAAVAQDDLPVLYVSDSFEVPVRATGCYTCTIVHYGLASGTVVYDLGEELDDWSRIRSQGGIEGWMPSRLLQQQPTVSMRFEQNQSELAQLQEENSLLLLQIDDLLSELTSMGLAVETVELESEEGEISRPVMSISGDVIGLNSQNEELIRRNQLMQQEIDILTARNERLEDSTWRSWFVYGALAVVAGALLSVLLPRLIPRRRYSEWG